MFVGDLTHPHDWPAVTASTVWALRARGGLTPTGHEGPGLGGDEAHVLAGEVDLRSVTDITPR